MKNRILLIMVLLIAFGIEMNAQKYFTRSGKVSFHSKAMLEDIDAYNNQATFVFDSESKQVQMAVLIKAFNFEKALMQEHFNENYMESDKFPKAVFKGKIKSPANIDLSIIGDIPICEIEGDLTIRGISIPMKTTASFKVDKDGIKGNTTFPVSVADFNISIPSVVKDKIAKEVEVKVDLSLEKMK